MLVGMMNLVVEVVEVIVDDGVGCVEKYYHPCFNFRNNYIILVFSYKIIV